MRRDTFRYILVFLLILLSIGFIFRNRLQSETDTPGIPLESNPTGTAITPISNITLVANEKSDSVSIFDLNTERVLLNIPVGKAPKGVAIDRELNIAIIGNSHDDTVSIIDLNTYQVIAVISVGKQPEGIAANPINHTALVANHEDDTVSVIDLTSLSVINTISVGKEPIDVAIDPKLNIALIVNERDYNVSVVDLNTYQETGMVSIGKRPQAIDINPGTHLAAVVNEKDNSITVIDLQTWETYPISVGKHPIEIAVNPLDNRALVICDEDRSMVLIDLDTHTIVKNYALNKFPRGVAVNNFTNIAAIVDDKTDSLTLIQLPNPVPEIASILPNNTGRGGDELSVTIEGEKFINLSTVYYDGKPLNAIFMDNSHIKATISKEMLSYAGVFPVTVSNPQPEGGTSNSVDFTIINPIPSITAIDPAETIAETESLTLEIYGFGFFSDTEVYLEEVKKAVTYINNTKLQVGLTLKDLETPGSYEILASNSPPGGGNSNKVILTIKSPLEITITSPSGGDTINESEIIVKGTFKSDTNDVGITVNGIVAEVIGKEWIAGNVPLTVGENIITANATDLYGNTDTKVIIIYANDITQQIELSANITSGISPLTTYFSESTSFVPALYQMDFEGDRVIDYTGTTFDDINHTFASEGIFYPTLTILDDQGNTYSDTIAVTVLNKTEIDNLLRSKWISMADSLSSGNTEIALARISSHTRESYKEMFNVLNNQLPFIVSTQTELNLISIKDNIATYELVTLENGRIYSYEVIFLNDTNGIWKISEF